MTYDITPEIRRLEITDIPQLIECVKRCYGDSYPFKEIYDSAALEKIISSKMMYSVVAQHPDGQIMAIAH
jgi:hypothetical protein